EFKEVYFQASSLRVGNPNFLKLSNACLRISLKVSFSDLELISIGRTFSKLSFKLIFFNLLIKLSLLLLSNHILFLLAHMLVLWFQILQSYHPLEHVQSRGLCILVVFDSV